MLGKIEGRRRRGSQRMRWLDGITNAMSMNLGKLREKVRDREACMLLSLRSQRVLHDWATEQQQPATMTELPMWCSGKDAVCNAGDTRNCRFDPWVRKIPWRREWQPNPVFLPGKFHGQRSLVGYNLQGC